MSPTILNLACGVKTSDHCVNIDWSIYLRLRRFRLSKLIAPLIFNGHRWERYCRIGENIVLHDLSKGIPYPDCSVDAIYHSHFLEHLDRDTAPRFLRETLRVLKPGGIQRIVVPDFAKLCKWYLENLEQCLSDVAPRAQHDKFIESIVLQMVRTEAPGTELQGPTRRFLENLALGSARDRGDVHRWMYDEVSLKHLLSTVGYKDIKVCTYQTSDIPGWTDTKLDVDDAGNEYKIESLYMECCK